MATLYNLRGSTQRVFTIGNLYTGYFTIDTTNYTTNHTWKLPNSDGTSGYVLTTDGSGNLSWNSTVTSFSGGLTGLTPSSATSGVITLAGTLDIGYGGTGQSSASAAFNALAPTVNAGDIIYYNGSTNTNLGIGTSGQILTVVSGEPAWENIAVSSYSTIVIPNTAVSSVTITPSYEIYELTIPSGVTTSLAITISNGYVIGQYIRLEFQEGEPTPLITVNGLPIVGGDTYVVPLTDPGGYAFTYYWTGSSWVFWQTDAFPGSSVPHPQSNAPGSVVLGYSQNTGTYSLVGMGGYNDGGTGSLVLGGLNQGNYNISLSPPQPQPPSSVFSDLNIAIGSGAISYLQGTSISQNGYSQAYGMYSVTIGGTAGDENQVLPVYGSISNLTNTGIGNYTATVNVRGNYTSTWQINDNIVMSPNIVTPPGPNVSGTIISTSYVSPNTEINVSITVPTNPTNNNNTPTWLINGAQVALYDLMSGFNSFSYGIGALSVNRGEICEGYAYNVNTGDSSGSRFHLCAQTTSHTGVIATLDGSSATTNILPGASNRLVIVIGEAKRLHCEVIARDVTSSTAHGTFSAGFTVVVNNVNGTVYLDQGVTSDGTTVCSVGTLSSLSLSNVTATVNASYQSIDFTVNGINSITIDWHIQIISPKAA